MKGLELPERTEDFTADPVELFFDLAYVFAFSQLVGVLVHDPDWTGVGRAALLFGLLWLPWQQLTWAANAVSGNGRRIRLIFLVATVISVPMAAATSSALGTGGPTFAISLALIMVLGFVIQTLSAESGSGFQRAVLRWVAPNAAAIVVLVAGGFLDGGARVFAWLVALVIVFGAMVAAGDGEWVIRSGHFAERHALIVIVALGEVIVAIGLPVVEALADDATPSARTLTALVASGSFAALLWWAYFDRPGPALEHRAESLVTDVERGRYVRDVYTWAHAPIVAGVILSAVALEETALHPADPVPLSIWLMLLAGLVLFLGAVSIAIWRAYRAIALERIVAMVLIAAVVLAGASWEGLYLIASVVVLLGLMLVVEHVRLEKQDQQARAAG